MTEIKTIKLEAGGLIAGLEPLPEPLAREISVMRREPAQFVVSGHSKCAFCSGREKGAFQIAHAKTKDAGSWCSTHGWLYFQSDLIRPNGDEYVPKRRREANG